jgi:hypothetical protein
VKLVAKIFPTLILFKAFIVYTVKDTKNVCVCVCVCVCVREREREREREGDYGVVEYYVHLAI